MDIISISIVLGFIGITLGASLGVWNAIVNFQLKGWLECTRRILDNIYAMTFKEDYLDLMYNKKNKYNKGHIK